MEPPRRSVGQTCASKSLLIGCCARYEVVAKCVAVRTHPSLEASFFRRLNRGAHVEMFEWDATRSSLDLNGFQWFSMDFNGFQSISSPLYAQDGEE